MEKGTTKKESRHNRIGLEKQNRNDANEQRAAMNKYKWIKLKFLTFPIKQSSSFEDWKDKATERKEYCGKIILRQE